MKRFLCLLIVLLMLCGCQGGGGETTGPAETTAPPAPSILDDAAVWDDSGALYEITLNVPNLWKYHSILDYNGNLLLWCLDTHRESDTMELCLVDLEVGGFVTARIEMPQGCYNQIGTITPQVFGEYLYICDNLSGRITALDDSLQTVNTWQAEPGDGVWYMGGEETVYCVHEMTLTAMDLATGEREELLTGENHGLYGDTLRLAVPEGAGRVFYVLDLRDSTMEAAPFPGEFGNLYRHGDTWLATLMRDEGVAYLMDGDSGLRIEAEECQFRLTEQGHILEHPYSQEYLRLYTADGKFVSQCTIGDGGSFYVTHTMIWNEALGGYFFQAHGSDGGIRLFFWDLNASTTGQDLQTGPIPDGTLGGLRTRADELEQTYGVEILLGEECATEFWSFVTEHATDWEQVNGALDTLEEALSAYPEGFFRQLKWNSVQGVQIQLVQNLQATDERAGGSYAAFVQEDVDWCLAVMDINSSDVRTYYHEFSHVIDSYLLWYTQWNYDAVYTGGGWEDLNPEGFQYWYSYTAIEPWFEDETYNNYFIDTYATVSPTEDRARVMEYAMMENNHWSFEGRDGLLAKLDFYCRSIRDAFDTTGWPETTLWEQYLYLAE